MLPTLAKVSTPRGFMGLVYMSYHYLPSRRLTAKAPENRPKRPKRKRSSSNHPFSGANLLLVSGRVLIWVRYCLAMKVHYQFHGSLGFLMESMNRSFPWEPFCYLFGVHKCHNGWFFEGTFWATSVAWDVSCGVAPSQDSSGRLTKHVRYLKWRYPPI